MSVACTTCRGIQTEPVRHHGEIARANRHNVRQKSERELWYCFDCNAAFNPSTPPSGDDLKRRSAGE